MQNLAARRPAVNDSGRVFYLGTLFRMSLFQFLVQIILTCLAAFLGAYLTRRAEQVRHLRELRSAAYADFLRGFAKAGRAQAYTLRDGHSLVEERDASVLVADARGRISIYGGRDVINALSRFIGLGTQTQTPVGMQAFTDLCMQMRAEAGMERTEFDAISRLLFS